MRWKQVNWLYLKRWSCSYNTPDAGNLFLVLPKRCWLTTGIQSCILIFDSLFITYIIVNHHCISKFYLKHVFLINISICFVFKVHVQVMLIYVIGVPHVCSCNCVCVCVFLFLAPLRFDDILHTYSFCTPPSCHTIFTCMPMVLSFMPNKLASFPHLFKGSVAVAVTARRTSSSSVLRPKGQEPVPAWLCQTWTQRWERLPYRFSKVISSVQSLMCVTCVLLSISSKFTISSKDKWVFICLVQPVLQSQVKDLPLSRFYMTPIFIMAWKFCSISHYAIKHQSIIG